MDKLFYYPTSRLTFKLKELVLEGKHITVEGITYQLLFKRPPGRPVKRTLTSMDQSTQLILF